METKRSFPVVQGRSRKRKTDEKEKTGARRVAKTGKSVKGGKKLTAQKESYAVVEVARLLEKGLGGTSRTKAGG